MVGLENFETGYKHNLGQALEDADKGLKTKIRQLNADNFTYIEGDICDLETCRKAIDGVDSVLHQAAPGSFPRSIEDLIDLTNPISMD